MKKTYHLCLSGGDEILFRDEEDYNRGFNYFALALYKTDSTGLVESFQSTHCHKMVQTEDPVEFMYLMRQSYSKYFNRKYDRHGRVGENAFHIGDSGTVPPSCRHDIRIEKRSSSRTGPDSLCLPALFRQRHLPKGDGEKTPGKTAG